eukprot:CAMPEP_0201519122 /NCGR_PEP_ID=MMETSP0161_2-20130828/9759_1 /ASSEMBLY_ACC=CAM_ASM_000251 /TAXON_ID=180227 /ORGANISM="Neoparamoeba aestuarina, Strain SoJaBio B1-5/56/2" /LENGTH=277 /DNA_ID=CAMNT_0047917067 /DNA_START=201 /DNA_END=1031 /DNA_ORIENTATION=+
MTDIKNFQKDLLNELGVPSYTIYDFLDRFNLDPSLQERRWEFWGKKKVALDDAKQFNLNDLGAVEQIVCAHGRRFIATYFSTFSAHIVRLRGYLPFKTIRDDEHLFWDRYLPYHTSCQGNAAPESCDSSWSGNFRGSLWATEFEEGWLHYHELAGRREYRRLAPPLEAGVPTSTISSTVTTTTSPNRAEKLTKIRAERKEWLSQRIKDRLEKGQKKNHGFLDKSSLSPEVGPKKNQENQEKKVINTFKEQPQEKPVAAAKEDPQQNRKAFLQGLKQK